ncbi:MAG: tripartite tricarboxylate transporter substrate binding protein [Betaproteobacteria bacterium]|nr:tripartite tricarboxylate transporter substrate binding protein [Betaproteobacteria bacterium]
MNRLLSTAAALLAFALPQMLSAQTYPNKPIRVVIPYAAGGGGDIVGRTIGAKLSEAWGQQILIDNKPGAGGNIGTEFVAKSAPDGYTLLLGTDIQMAINPHVYKSLPYNPDRDFAFVVQAAFIDLLLTVHPSIPANNLTELIAHLKANPGKYSYGSSGYGSTHHLSMELLKSMTGIDMVHVPYKGSGQMLPDLISGQVQLSTAGISQTMPYVRSGKLKAIAVGSAKRLDAAPGVPAIAETLPGFEANASWNYFAPAGTPREIVMQLNAEINRILKMDDIRERFASQGLIPIGGTRESLAERMKSDYVKWGKVVKDIGLKVE